MRNDCIYIVLTRTNTVISKLIHTIKHDAYTHAAISLDENFEQMYSFGRRSTYNPFIGKFRKEDLDGGVYNLCPALPGVIIEIKVTGRQYKKAKALIEHFTSKGDVYKYNYMGILHSFLNKPVNSDNRFLCSEFVYHVLRESEVVELGIPRNLVRPQDLLKIPGTIVYEGDLKKMPLSGHHHREMTSLSLLSNPNPSTNIGLIPQSQ